LSTIRQFEHLATPGTGHQPFTPTELEPNEVEAFLYCRENNLRIEQEHILQSEVNAALAERSMG